tara:strand:+ start:484 stop:972 length:489 start_codon:yes stop_codon:yes gene_type:complete
MRIRFLIPLLALFLLPLKVSGGSYQITEDIMTDDKVIVFALLSENNVSNEIGVKESAGLIVSCRNGKPKLFFSTPTYNGNNNYVGTRWDKEKASYNSWNESSAGTGFFHRKPKKIINEMREKDTLTLGWNPYQRREEAVKFDLNSQNWKQDIEQAIKDGCKL